jgi:hypothetical protein
MVEAALSGRVRLNAIAQSVDQFVRASYRMDHNKFGPLSLDMPAFQEGETRLVETTEGLTIPILHTPAPLGCARPPFGALPLRACSG